MECLQTEGESEKGLSSSLPIYTYTFFALTTQFTNLSSDNIPGV